MDYKFLKYNYQVSLFFSVLPVSAKVRGLIQAYLKVC